MHSEVGVSPSDLSPGTPSALAERVLMAYWSTKLRFNPELFWEQTDPKEQSACPLGALAIDAGVRADPLTILSWAYQQFGRDWVWGFIAGVRYSVYQVAHGDEQQSRPGFEHGYEVHRRLKFTLNSSSRVRSVTGGSK